MARIYPIPENEQPANIKLAFEEHVQQYAARITNMKATLGHSLLAFKVYMQWYPLYEAVQAITGKRLAYLYAYAISTASGCPLCSTFFRKIIVDQGESPESLNLNEHEQNVLNLGAAISKQQGKIEKQVYETVATRFSNEELVILIAFAGQMIATNIFSNVTETDIDDYLTPYIKGNE